MKERNLEPGRMRDRREREKKQRKRTGKERERDRDIDRQTEKKERKADQSFLIHEYDFLALPCSTWLYLRPLFPLARQHWSSREVLLHRAIG